ncbi:NAD(P)-dependent oxidoreductase [Streptomyces sp. MBT97]|uniref:NAD-dependent epimerase/dehydratase family protein n=1 Tax=Streptomyces sp. MBT97 TaxID=2800411 RepID=UPI00190E41F2|nr:NAD-dependent epimerase/dehydratase family protein [Streptomyces sp. MBT97]MBK3631950.1 NAD(P)-dependent oxidoreductase [Streptomyces sp. MBT97]
MRGERVAVLGGAGCLGTHITRVLAGAGVDVTVLSRRLPPGFPQARTAVQALPQGPSAAVLSEALAECGAEVVVNAAGATQGDARTMVQSNVRLIRNLVRAIAALPNRPRVVQIGSAAEYGAQPGRTAITELTACSPVGLYGRTKLAATDAVLEAIREGAIQGAVLRVFNPIGPVTPVNSVLGTVGTQLIRQRYLPNPLVETGSLDTYRDFVDVRDVASAVLLAVRHEAPPPVVNIARGEAVSVRSLVRRLVQISGVPARLLERPVLHQHRSQGLNWQQAALGVVQLELGWHPRYGLHTSLHDLWTAATETGVEWAGGADEVECS